MIHLDEHLLNKDHMFCKLYLYNYGLIVITVPYEFIWLYCICKAALVWHFLGFLNILTHKYDGHLFFKNIKTAV